ncbi:MAG: response regulator transcription factor [Chloroflexi bacterium]|nr:response regulator transcription factor [Chloroflexota bacterium]
MTARILLVEDHAMLRHAIAEYLTTFVTAQIIQAANAESALELAQSDRPDLVIMDIVLPRMNGIQATRQLKETDPSLPVIILTFHDETSHRDGSLEAGAEAFIPKDSLLTMLIPAVQRSLGLYGPEKL